MKAFSVSTQAAISFPGEALTNRKLCDYLQNKGVEFISKPGIPSLGGFKQVACDPCLIVSSNDLPIVKKWLKDHDYQEQAERDR